MSGLLLLVPLNLCLPVIKPTHYYISFSFNPKGVPPSLVWWFHRDSNPNVFSSVAKCFIQLNYETIVVPTGLEPVLFCTKNRRVANYTTGQLLFLGYLCDGINL